MNVDTLIRDARLVIPHHGIEEGSVGIDDGKIAIISKSADLVQADRIVDAKGRYVFPGVIDPHVHLGNYAPYHEDAKTETRSAVAGGVTTIITLLKTPLSTFTRWGNLSTSEQVEMFEHEDLREELRLLIKETETLSYCDFAYHMNVALPTQIEHLLRLYEEFGVQSFKLFMAYRRPIGSGVTDGVIHSFMKRAANLKPPPLTLVHCESEELIEAATEDVRRKGNSGLRAWHEARPDVAEEVAVARAALLAKDTGVPLYVPHLSSARALAVIKWAMRQGAKVIPETTPHYLALNDGLNLGGLAKVTPSIKSAADSEALWNGIIEGVIRCIGTDHNTATLSAKSADIFEVKIRGFAGVETMFPIMLSEGLKRGISPTRIAEICSSNSAKAFGMYPTKGSLTVGSDADLTMVDVNSDKIIRASQLHSASDYTVYEGMRVSCWPVATILRGRSVYEDGKFLGSSGKYLPRYPRGIKAIDH